MSAVVSATTRFDSQSRSLKNSSGAFLHKAHLLLAEAIEFRRESRYDLALEAAYQAALRTAAARIAQSPVAKRKRKPTSAWEQLRMVGEIEAQWAQLFSGYSTFRSRVGSGIETTVPLERVTTLITQVGKFLDDVEMSLDDTPVAA